MNRSRKQVLAARRRARNRWVSLAVVAALLLAGLVGWRVYQSQRDDEFPTPAHATGDGSGVAQGQGPVTVEIWLDLHCPHCREFEEQVGDTVDQLVADGAITLVYHPVAFPDRFSTTAYSTRAAAAVGCAADDGAQVAYVAALLAAQPPSGGPGLDAEQLVQVGESVGSTGQGFSQCVSDERYEGWVGHVTEAAARAGVTGTPTVRVAGNDVDPTAAAITAAVQAVQAGADS